MIFNIFNTLADALDKIVRAGVEIFSLILVTKFTNAFKFRIGLDYARTHLEMTVE